MMLQYKKEKNEKCINFAVGKESTEISTNL